MLDIHPLELESIRKAETLWICIVKDVISWAAELRNDLSQRSLWV